MTALEATEVPTCPMCATSDRVARDTYGGGVTDSITMACWLCVGCWTVFLGDQSEWERTRKRRERRASWRENMARNFLADIEANGQPVWATQGHLERARIAAGMVPA